jgi:hypothetical protein
MNRVWFFTAMIILGVMSCEKSPFATTDVACSCAPPPDSATVTVGYGKKAIVYQCCENEISIAFAKVLQDSRCPTGVACPWQGTAIIGITVNDEDLITAIEINNPISKKIPGINYNIHLLELNPYPGASGPVNPNNYVAKIRLKKG